MFLNGGLNMGVVVSILEYGGDGGRSLGEYEIFQLPTKGDRVVVPAPTGSLDIMEVLYVEYSTIRIPRSRIYEDAEPTVRVYVEFVERYDG
jgi:hypothetical protein